MRFDPKKVIDSTLDQMSESSRRSDERGRSSYGSERDADELIYRMSRDLEEIRIKNRELNDRIGDLEMKFSSLRDLMRNKRY